MIVEEDYEHYKEGLRSRLIGLGHSIAEALERSGRRGEQVTIVAVSKKQPAWKMRAYQDLLQERGEIPVFGENYVQEFLHKMGEIKEPYEVHLIGPMQRNKAKFGRYFSLIQSVHNVPLINELQKASHRDGRIQRILLEVNISNDPNKSGFKADQVIPVINEIKQSTDGIKCEGLMTITEHYESREQVRSDYHRMSELLNQIKKELELPFPVLSMGMSQDFEIAIEEGATMVRVGSALFGERS